MKTNPGSMLPGLLLAGGMIFLSAGCNKPQATVARIDDSTLSAAVRAAFLADAEGRNFDFKVESRKGKVQLSGFVDTQPQIDHAIAVTRRVPGVRGIRINVSANPRGTGRKGLPPSGKIDAPTVPGADPGLLAAATVKLSGESPVQ